MHLNPQLLIVLFVIWRLLFVGLFVPHKHPLLLLEAISDVHSILLNAGATISFIGKGPLESEIRKFADTNDLNDVVRIVGFIADLNSFYSSSDFLISTSKFEGLPITFFEAKQHGLRVITTPSSGDFDVLGTEDQILSGFERRKISEALVSAVLSGQLTPGERETIQMKNVWMSAENCAQKYYKLITSVLGPTP